MPRIPYKPADITDPKEIVDVLRSRRNGDLLNLDRMLLHSPPVAKGWALLFTEFKTGSVLSPKLQELAACVVSQLNGAEYGFQQHAPQFLRAGGTPQQVEALRIPEAASHDGTLFVADELATIRVAFEMTRNVGVSDAAFLGLREALPSDRHVVELIMIVATFNMVSRFLVSLDVEMEH
jgi:AhpD family alkylhydroperoxidase